MSATIEYQNNNNHKQIPYKYTEYKSTLSDGVIDISFEKRHGRYIEFYSNGNIRYSYNYENGKRVGLQYTFPVSEENSNAYPESITSISADGTKPIEYSVYLSGNLRSISNKETNEYSEYTQSGNQTYHQYTEDNFVYCIWYKKGIPLTMIVREIKSEYKWKIEYAGQTIRQILHGHCHNDDHIKIKNGFSIKRQMANIIVSYYDNDTLITNQVRDMCIDPVMMTAAEETMINLAFNQDFRGVVPDIIREYYDTWIHANRDKIIYV